MQSKLLIRDNQCKDGENIRLWCLEFGRIKTCLTHTHTFASACFLGNCVHLIFFSFSSLFLWTRASLSCLKTFVLPLICVSDPRLERNLKVSVLNSGNVCHTTLLEKSTHENSWTKTIQFQNKYFVWICSKWTEMIKKREFKFDLK